MRRSGYRPPEIHHLGITGRHGGKRRGHDFTVGLCPWHHRGIASLDDRHRGLTVWDLEVWLGPSLQKHARRFREEFGEDGPLLEYQNKLLGIATPEPEFGLPKIVPRRLAP